MKGGVGVAKRWSAVYTTGEVRGSGGMAATIELVRTTLFSVEHCSAAARSAS